MQRWGKVWILGVVLVMMTGAPLAGAPAGDNVSQPLRLDYRADEVKKLCDDALALAKKRLDAILAVPAQQRTFENTVAAYEHLQSDLDDSTTLPLHLLARVSPDKALQSAADEGENRIRAFLASIKANGDLWNALVAVSDRAKLSGEDARLVEVTLRDLKRNGAALSQAQRQEFAALKADLARLEGEFNRNIAQADDAVVLDRDHLEGLSEDLVAGLKPVEAGKTWSLTLMDGSRYGPFMQNARKAEVRKRVLMAREQVAAATNVPILEKALGVRRRLAHLLAYPSHAAYVLDDSMAKSPAKIEQFLGDAARALAPKARAELDALLALKKRDDPMAMRIDPWDVAYYCQQLMKTRYAVDDEAIREYFPVDHVLATLFDVNQRLLGVKFRELPPGTDGLPVWAPEVRLFEVRDEVSGRRIAFFYMDLYPRQNKDKYIKELTVRHGRRLLDGTCQAPIAAIIAQFPSPRPDRPALLYHGDVVLLFHEFGHVMHETLSEAVYGQLSGTFVPRDFVEAPSQMMEEWVWDPVVLRKLSRHYKSGQALPEPLVERMRTARYATDGIYYTKQLVYALSDQAYHSATGPVDTTAVFARFKRDISFLEMVPGGRPQAVFWHLMGEYDAGYYGYLWSKVFAVDMFTCFRKAGLDSREMGRRYRETILARGNAAEPGSLIRDFLGRAPSSEAFYRSLGL